MHLGLAQSQGDLNAERLTPHFLDRFEYRGLRRRPGCDLKVGKAAALRKTGLGKLPAGAGRIVAEFRGERRDVGCGSEWWRQQPARRALAAHQDELDESLAIDGQSQGAANPGIAQRRPRGIERQVARLGQGGAVEFGRAAPFVTG